MRGLRTLSTLQRCLFAVAALACAASGIASAQSPAAQAPTQTAAIDLPDAPVAQSSAPDPQAPAPQPQAATQQTSSSNPKDVAQPDVAPNKKVDVVGAPLPPSTGGKQPKRILGIIPNFRAVSAGTKLPKQTVKEKFVTATEDTFDYSAFSFSTLVALEAFATNATPEFGPGAVGFGRTLWHTIVDQSIENYFVEFIIPAPMHEDTRYYTLGHGRFVKRMGYSLGHVLVTRNDNGKNVVNTGEIVGAAMAASVSNFYYPSQERSFSNTARNWGTDVGLDAITFAFKEFWPDIDHKFLHDK